LHDGVKATTDAASMLHLDFVIVLKRKIITRNISVKLYAI